MRLRLSRVQAALLIGCIAMLATLCYALVSPAPALVIPAPGHAPHPAAPFLPSSFTPPPSARFAAVTARSVFNPERHAFDADPSPDAQKSAPPPPPTVTLVGVILDGTTKLALIRAPGASFATAIPMGDSVAGWQISAIDQTGITLRFGDAEQHIALSGGTDAAH